MSKPKPSFDRKKTGATRKSGKSGADKAKHPFKQFMETKRPGKPAKPAFRGRDDRKTHPEKNAKDSHDERPREKRAAKQESGRAPSGRRFFKKEADGNRENNREFNTPDERNTTSKRSNSKGSRKTYSPSPRRADAERKPFRENTTKSERFSKPKGRSSSPSGEKRFKRDEFVSGEGFERQSPNKEFKKGTPSKSNRNADDQGLIRLNKYLSNAGIASRRDADTLIISGAVKVNGEVVNTLGAKIRPGDKVTYGDQSVKGERKVYLLLNKPKDYITTMEDERDRKTVMKLVEGACKERIYPVGRLDRNTTGLLLMTNDGELTTKLTHPKHGIKKVYHVSLNKSLKPEHFKEIIEGVELEDGKVNVDDLAFVGEGKKEVGVEIHSGRNRVVRRLFEHLGYDVIKLDRVVFAGLTKKDLPRGKYRFLSAKEISFLQMIG
ncbi:MAG: rRNA pseudouridine synthase [Bacteroidia bacterium]|jgi:23S rRNA pseudouridine2605 synthase|nr:rRNA pseudouridine synthase [Bacteroidia bacterium]